MIPVVPKQTGNVTLIPIFSLQSKPTTCKDKQENESSRYIIFLSNLSRFSLIGTSENACPHCGALDLKQVQTEVFAYPKLDCCIPMIKQHITWSWEELKAMSLKETWSVEEVNTVDALHRNIRYLELCSKALEPTGGT